jgi:hypothetical protein
MFIIYCITLRWPRAQTALAKRRSCPAASRAIKSKKNGLLCLACTTNNHLQYHHHHHPLQEHSLFVGDLAPEVTDVALLSAFAAYFPSAHGAKVRAPFCFV